MICCRKKSFYHIDRIVLFVWIKQINSCCFSIREEKSNVIVVCLLITFLFICASTFISRLHLHETIPFLFLLVSVRENIQRLIWIDNKNQSIDIQSTRANHHTFFSRKKTTEYAREKERERKRYFLPCSIDVNWYSLKQSSHFVLFIFTKNIDLTFIFIVHQNKLKQLLCFFLRSIIRNTRSLFSLNWSTVYYDNLSLSF